MFGQFDTYYQRPSIYSPCLVHCSGADGEAAGCPHLQGLLAEADAEEPQISSATGELMVRCCNSDIPVLCRASSLSRVDAAKDEPETFPSVAEGWAVAAQCTGIAAQLSSSGFGEAGCFSGKPSLVAFALVSFDMASWKPWESRGDHLEGCSWPPPGFSSAQFPLAAC